MAFRYNLPALRGEVAGQVVNVISPEGKAIGADMTRVRFAPERVNVYADDWRVQGGSV